MAFITSLYFFSAPLSLSARSIQEKIGNFLYLIRQNYHLETCLNLLVTKIIIE